jgi:phytoene dehydrogenase-like protein
MIVVIGAGVNGLACALELARAGKKVVVLDRRDAPGGLSGRRAFDGFSVPGIRHDTQELRPALVQALGLAAHGLVLKTEHVPVFASEAEGDGMVMHVAPERAEAEIARRSKKDAGAYASLRGLFARVRGILEPVVERNAPPLMPKGFSETVDMGLLGLKLRGLGRKDMIEVLRAAPMCVADWMREQFETELLSATLALPAVLGDYVGPWSPGTAAMFILREALLVPGAQGGPAAVVDALVRALGEAKVTVRTGARVTRIDVESGTVKGVTLEGGEAIAAEAVVAACSPRHALTELLEPFTLSVRDNAAARAIRTRGTAAKIHLGLREAPEWRGRPGEAFERVRIGAHLDDLERAFDAAKYRTLPTAPVLDIAVHDATLSILVHAVPYDLDGGWTASAKEVLLERVLRVLDPHAPKLRERLQAREVLSPVDLEREFGTTGGSLHHVERALDQMVLMRPARPFARAATPVEGLYLGSSGCHPGPGVTLAPGVLSARAVLAR